jgi:AraC-like DNA-binding protein
MASQPDHDLPVFYAALPMAPGHVSIDYLHSFFGRKRAEALLAEAMPDHGGIEAIDAVDHFTFWRMCIDNVLRNNDETHGIAVAPLQRSTWGMVFSAVNQMEDVGNGLKRFAQLVSILSVGITVTLSYSARGTHVRYDMVNPNVADSRLDRYLESLAMFFHCVMVAMADQAFEPIELRLSERLRDTDGSLWNAMQCPTGRRGSGMTVIYDRQATAVRLGRTKYQCWCTQGTETLFRILGSVGSTRIPQRGVSEAVRRLLETMVISLDDAADHLAFSAATLRRRLTAEGTSFRALRRQVRMGRLTSLLATDGNLDDIAVEIGLSDRRSLARMCNGLLGMSPSSYRTSARQGAGQ